MIHDQTVVLMERRLTNLETDVKKLRETVLKVGEEIERAGKIIQDNMLEIKTLLLKPRRRRNES